jgi:hypothetical protein
MAIIALTGRAGSGKDTVASVVQELYPEMNWQIKGFADKLRQVASLLTGIPADDMKKQEVKEMVLGEEWWYYHLGYTDHKISYHEAQNGGYGEMDFDDLTQLTVRSFLQKLGTDAVRDNIHENAWVNALMCDYNEIVFKHIWHKGEYWCTCMKCNEKFTGHKLQRFCKPCCDIEYRSWPNWLITDCRFPNELAAITAKNGICIRIIRPDNPYPQSNHISETALDGVELTTIINDGNLDQLKLSVQEIFDPIAHRVRTSGSC